jgi:hypothetical protein
MNRSETIWKLEELTGSHDEETCNGCSTCSEIAGLRDKLLFNQRVVDTLAKGKEMTKSDIKFLLSKDVQVIEIRKAVGIAGNRFTELMQNWGFSKRRGDTEMGKLKKFTAEEYQDLKAQGLNDTNIAERKGVTPASISAWKKENDLSSGKVFGKKKDNVKVIAPVKNLNSGVATESPKETPKNEYQSLISTLKREKEVMEKGLAQYKEDLENLKISTVSRNKYNELENDYKESEYERVKNYEEYKKMEEAYQKEHATVIQLDAEVVNLREQLNRSEKNNSQYLEENEHLRGLVRIWV